MTTLKATKNIDEILDFCESVREYYPELLKNISNLEGGAVLSSKCNKAGVLFHIIFSGPELAEDGSRLVLTTAESPKELADMLLRLDDSAISLEGKKELLHSLRQMHLKCRG